MNVGEEFVAEYLKYIKKCAFVDKNVPVSPVLCPEKVCLVQKEDFRENKYP